MTAPGDRDDDALQVAGKSDFVRPPQEHGRNRDQELAAEVLAGVAGDGVGHLAHQVLVLGEADLGLAEAAQQLGQLLGAGGEVHRAAVAPGDADHPGEVQGDRVLALEVRWIDLRRLARDPFKIAHHAVDEDLDLLVAHRRPQASAIRLASARLRSSAENGLSTYSLAPRSTASMAVLASPRAEITIRRVSGFRAIILEMQVRPSISGMVRSMVTNSGR